MRIRFELFIAAAAVFALCLASPAEAAKKKHKHKRAAAAYSHGHPQVAAPGTHAWAARSGPLYNGPDYLGDDPDPNIRAYILKDLGMRYGGAY